MDGSNDALIPSEQLHREASSNSVPPSTDEQQHHGTLPDLGAGNPEEVIGSLKGDNEDAHAICTDPAWRFPPEIMGGIMMYASSDNTIDPYPMQTPVGHRFPWLISHVSSRWHAIALGLPTLWSRIYIESKTGPLDTMFFLRTTLTRSAGAPLDITCRLDENTGPLLLDTLLSASARWHNVTLMLNEPLFPRLQEIKVSFPLLKSIFLVNMPVNFSYDDQPILAGDWLLRAPRLCEVTFGRIVLPESVDAFPMAWDQLHSLNSHTLGGIHSVIKRISLCTQLRRYNSAQDALMQPFPINDYPPISLLHLEELAVNIYSSQELLSLLRVPNLQVLQMKIKPEQLRRLMAPLQAIIKGAKTLREVEVNVWEDEVEDLDELWRRLGQLLETGFAGWVMGLRGLNTLDTFSIDLQVAQVSTFVSTFIPQLLPPPYMLGTADEDKYLNPFPALQLLRISISAPRGARRISRSSSTQFAGDMHGLYVNLQNSLALRSGRFRTLKLDVSEGPYARVFKSVFSAEKVQQLRSDFPTVNFIIPDLVEGR